MRGGTLTQHEDGVLNKPSNSNTRDVVESQELVQFFRMSLRNGRLATFWLGTTLFIVLIPTIGVVLGFDAAPEWSISFVLSALGRSAGIGLLVTLFVLFRRWYSQ